MHLYASFAIILDRLINWVIIVRGEVTDVNHKLGRILQPSMGLYFMIVVVFPVLAVLFGQYLLAGILFVLVAMLFALFCLYEKNRRKEVQKFIRSIAGDYEPDHHRESPFPLLVIRMQDGAVVFANETFHSITEYREGFAEKHVGDVLPGFQTDWLSAGKSEYPYDLTIRDRRYRVYGSVVRTDTPQKIILGLLYFTDLTELYQIRDEYIRSRPVVSIVLIDNYEELTKNMTDSAVSSLDAKINDAITLWTEPFHGLFRKLERNRFLFVFEKCDLRSATEDKFSILEDIHAITNSSGLKVSLSIGVGVDGMTFEECYNFASLSIEMALSRGGDQAVVKDRYNFAFYGGRHRETEHRSTVRSRVTANSLMELIGQSSQVFIMGHKNADFDSLGAAMGIACLCRKKGKKINPRSVF